MTGRSPAAVATRLQAAATTWPFVCEEGTVTWVVSSKKEPASLWSILSSTVLLGYPQNSAIIPTEYVKISEIDRIVKSDRVPGNTGPAIEVCLQDGPPLHLLFPDAAMRDSWYQSMTTALHMGQAKRTPRREVGRPSPSGAPPNPNLVEKVLAELGRGPPSSRPREDMRGASGTTTRVAEQSVSPMEGLPPRGQSSGTEVTSHTATESPSVSRHAEQDDSTTHINELQLQRSSEEATRAELQRKLEEEIARSKEQRKVHEAELDEATRRRANLAREIEMQKEHLSRHHEELLKQRTQIEMEQDKWKRLREEEDRRLEEERKKRDEERRRWEEEARRYEEEGRRWEEQRRVEEQRREQRRKEEEEYRKRQEDEERRWREEEERRR
eukprot:Sspe_Gene.8977::Locus_3023_Transcript_1_1_Confidence_1.000_Length_1228::g.8977::m.8977